MRLWNIPDQSWVCIHVCLTALEKSKPPISFSKYQPKQVMINYVQKVKLYDIQYFEIWIKHFVTIVVTIQLCGRLLSELHNWQECLYSITTALISDYNILMNLHELIIESILSKQTSFHSRSFISTNIQSKVPKIKVKLKKWMVQKANNNWNWRGEVIIRLWIQFDFLQFIEKV